MTLCLPIVNKSDVLIMVCFGSDLIHVLIWTAVWSGNLPIR